MSGEWFAELTEAGRPIFIDGYQVKTADVTRQADGSLSVAFGKQGSVVMASPELVLEWVAAVNTLTSERDRARDIAARLEGELAHLAELIDLHLWADAAEYARSVCPVHIGRATPWPHPDAEVEG